MSISIVIDGELWGLIACHHYSGPHRPSQDARSAAEFLGQVASQQIAERDRADAGLRALLTREMLTHLIGRLGGSNEPVLDALVDDPELLDPARRHGGGDDGRRPPAHPWHGAAPRRVAGDRRPAAGPGGRLRGPHRPARRGSTRPWRRTTTCPPARW